MSMVDLDVTPRARSPTAPADLSYPECDNYHKDLTVRPVGREWARVGDGRKAMVEAWSRWSHLALRAPRRIGQRRIRLERVGGIAHNMSQGMRWLEAYAGRSQAVASEGFGLCDCLQEPCQCGEVTEDGEP